NLNAGRGLWVAGIAKCLNVRRLMYQSLIWGAVLRHQARGLGAAFDAENLQSLADTLVDGVRRNIELGRDFLRRQMLVNQPQTVELPGRQPRHPPSHQVLRDALFGQPMISRPTI